MGYIHDRGLTKLNKKGLILALKKERNDFYEPCISMTNSTELDLLAVPSIVQECLS